MVYYRFMQISHYCNSFISAAVNKTLIVCDPWVGSTDITAWLSYPICKNGVNILNDLNPNFIYISHLHSDHFDTNLLSKFKDQWSKYVEMIDKMGRSIQTVQSDYEQLVTTRKRQLEKPLNEIEGISEKIKLPE